MDDDALPDIQSVLRVAQAKRRNAMRKMQEGRAMQSRGAELERDAVREMQEVEAFERLLKSVPADEQGLLALEADPREQMELRAKERLLESHFRSQRDQVVRAASLLLGVRSSMSTDELYQGLIQMGVKITSSNPVQRVSQILSGDNKFKNQRGVGWSLAGEASSESEPEDAKMIARARELAREDENGTLRRR